MRKQEINSRTHRAMFLLCAAGFMIFVFFARLVQLQIFQYNLWQQRSNKNHISKRVIDMKRGNIYDCRKTELAISVDTSSLFIYTPEVKSPQEVANNLSSVLPVSRDEILSKITKKQDYVLICKELEPKVVSNIKQLAIPGVKFEKHYHRYYPQKSLAANLIGFTGTDQHGLEGLEKKYETTLCGYPGIGIQEDISISDSEPSQMRVITPPMGGSNIWLTIDSRIQHTLESELQNLADQYKPIDAFSIIMNPYNGDILGMACYPTYNLNEFGSAKQDEIRNRPVIDNFEPGSCMKIFAVASALENGKGDESSRFYCKGYGEIPGRKIRCHGAHGLMSFDQAIAESCNGALTEISKILEPSMLYRTLKNAGFGDPTGVDVLSEGQGSLAPPSKWSAFSLSSLVMGHEMSVTGVQLVQAYSAIANGGLLIKPRLVKEITSSDDGMVEEVKTQVVRQIFSPELAKKLRRMLMGVVEKGTGRLAKLEDYTVGGKTSTAQKIDPNGTYSKTRVVCNFIGMVPAMDPKFVLLVVVNEPTKGNPKDISGGKVAAAPFARIADRVCKYMKIAPDRPGNAFLNNASKSKLNALVSNLSSNEYNAEVASGTSQGIVPNLIGKSLKNAIKIVGSNNLKAIYDGNGVVVSQFPKAGSPIPSRRLIKVVLSPD